MNDQQKKAQAWVAERLNKNRTPQTLGKQIRQKSDDLATALHQEKTAKSLSLFNNSPSNNTIPSAEELVKSLQADNPPADTVPFTQTPVIEIDLHDPQNDTALDSKDNANLTNIAPTKQAVENQETKNPTQETTDPDQAQDQNDLPQNQADQPNLTQEKITPAQEHLTQEQPTQENAIAKNLVQDSLVQENTDKENVTQDNLVQDNLNLETSVANSAVPDDSALAHSTQVPPSATDPDNPPNDERPDLSNQATFSSSDSPTPANDENTDNASDALFGASNNAPTDTPTQKPKQTQSEQANLARSKPTQPKPPLSPIPTPHKKGGLGILGRFGAYVGTLTGSEKHDFTKVDLSAPNFGDDAFHRQSGQILSQLFGTKGVQVEFLANKLLSDNTKQSASDWVYGKIATLAEHWALVDLKKDPRFDRLADLNNDEKTQFLSDITNENRGFAVLGGVAGLFGLKGVVLDTAWLLLISLKAVYQTAHITGTPLSGDDGIRLAYGILAGANLDKMQEKQVLMTGLALGKTVLKNAQSTRLADEIKHLSDKHQISRAEQLAVLAGSLEKLNGTLAQKLLPIGSGIIAGYYNGELIDEVLGVAKASFADFKTQASQSTVTPDPATTTSNTNTNTPPTADKPSDKPLDKPLDGPFNESSEPALADEPQPDLTVEIVELPHPNADDHSETRFWHTRPIAPPKTQ